MSGYLSDLQHGGMHAGQVHLWVQPVRNSRHQDCQGRDSHLP